jgi:hypothetical protein
VRDLIFAWLLGIAFQYFAVQPMGRLSNAQALIAAIKSDTLSIVTSKSGFLPGWPVPTEGSGGNAPILPYWMSLLVYQALYILGITFQLMRPQP